MSLWIISPKADYFSQTRSNKFDNVLAITARVGVSTAYLIPWSMIPDVIELDELSMDNAAEGIF